MHGKRAATVPSDVTIRRTVNGGYIVRHSYDNSSSGMSYTPPQEHAFATHKAAMAHVHKQTGGDAPTPAEGRQAAATPGGGVD